MKSLKVLEWLREALPLVLVLIFCYFNEVGALEEAETLKSLKGIHFYTAQGSENGEDGSTELIKGTTHSRGKRFIAFPVGSSFSTAVCLTTGVIGNPKTEYLSMGLNWGIAYELPNSTWVLRHANGFGPKDKEEYVAVCFTVGIIGNPRYNYMSFGLNWGVAYDLPNTTWVLNHLHGFAKRPVPLAVWHRRSRRSLYKEIENVVDNMGYNGRDCILRALCESRQYFQKTKMSMIGEMLRAVFSLPKQRVFTRESAENSDIELYDRAYRRARSIVDCAEEYDCGFSLLELAFGKYSTAPAGYYTNH